MTTPSPPTPTHDPNRLLDAQEERGKIATPMNLILAKDTYEVYST